ncbi:sigma-70 family RNA polymerase sigma factor [Patulibacter sp. NPDC049589]|uniref:RNA polymerase sigma factor n=1 Tax=Patulibacter sp. NPDC049589 TaxID=3154731 RepID=UPI003448B4A4
MPVTAPHRSTPTGSSRRQPFLTAATTPDSTLVQLAAAGDERAFEILFQRHRTDVLAYATRMLRDHGRAEDVVQDVFVSAMRAILGAAPDEQPVHVRAWLREIARRTCIDQWRGTTRRGEVSLDAPERLRPADADRLADDDSLARTTDGREAVATLRLAFDDLPELQHAVLVQRELEGRSIAEIAARLDVSPTVVEGQLARGRRALGQAYKELESGQRCISVRALCDASVGGRLGVRDRHRVGRHVQGCDGCRRYARDAGVDSRLVDRQLLSKASFLLPLPLLRRLPVEHAAAGEAAGGVLGAKVLVGAAVLAAGSSGVYAARVVPPADSSSSSTDAVRSVSAPTPLQTDAEGRPVLRISGPGGRTTTVRLPGGAAAPLTGRGIALFLPPWSAQAGSGTDAPEASSPAPARPPVADPVAAPAAPTSGATPPPAATTGPSRGATNGGSTTPTRTAPLTPTAPAAPGAADTTTADDTPSTAAPASTAGAADVPSDDTPAQADAPVVPEAPAPTPDTPADTPAADQTAPAPDAPIADTQVPADEPVADTATPVADTAPDSSTTAPDGGAAGGD